ncbi:MAG: tetratricopeptide repeat protein, partial [Planctomycetota bacterium]
HAQIVEGERFRLPVVLQAEPGLAELKWQRKDALPFLQTLSWRREQNLWVAESVTFGVGMGIAHVVVKDAAGNRAEGAFQLQVLPAVESLQIFPSGSVAPRSRIFLSYALRPSHQQEPLQLRIRAQGSADAQGQALERRSDRISLKSPARAGSYWVTLAYGDPPVDFQGGVPLLVEEVARPQVRSAEFSQDPALTLLLRFREFERRWRMGERSPAMEQERQALLADFQGQPRHHPQQVSLRRALARLQLYQETPNLNGAAALLEGALASPGNEAARPQLYSDLAKIEVDRRRFPKAEEYLVRANDLEESAVRRANLGRVLKAEKRYGEAVREFLRAVHLDPQRAELRRAWAECVSYLSNSDKLRSLEIVTGWLVSEQLSASEAERLERWIRVNR